MGDRLRVLHVITGLGVGGAEAMLVKVVGSIDRATIEPAVVSLLDEGELGERIKALDIPLYSLNLTRDARAVRGIGPLRQIVMRNRPHLLQTWLYHADILGGIACAGIKGMPVVWNIRNTSLHGERRRMRYDALLGFCAILSWMLPRGIICCSESAKRFHAGYGYRRSIMEVIPNGFDLDRFRPSQSLRASVRQSLNIPVSSPVIGHVGRFDPQKDHKTFLMAAAVLRDERPDAHFVLCGKDVTPKNPSLARDIAGLGLRSIHLLGVRHDMPAIYAAMDVLISSSGYGEGFPNVIGEAMASGLPCVVTDVGASRDIVGETGRLAAPRDYRGLAAGAVSLLRVPDVQRQALSQSARARIAAQFNVADIADRYVGYYERLLGGARSKPGAMS